jgi:peptidoglycan/LPS O-acetylase OafA/YrhL
MSTAILDYEPPAAQRTVPAAKAADRRSMLDVARLVAAYGIVWLHSPQSASFGRWTAPARFAVPFFTAAAVFLAWEGLARNRQRTLIEYARSRFVRIYIPFLAWSGIYLAFKAGKAVLLPDQSNVFPGVELLWLGSFYHLWFMPFILATTLAVFVIGRQVVGRHSNGPRTRENFALVVCLLLGWLIAWWPADRLSATMSFWQLASDALPAAFWAVALAIVWQRGAGAWLRRPAVAGVAFGLAVLLEAIVWYAYRSRPAENLAGIAFLIFALGDWRSPALARLGRLGPLAYGIYLAHPLFIKVLESVEAKLGLAENGFTLVGTFVIAAAASTLLAWSLSRSRWSRWLVG